MAGKRIFDSNIWIGFFAADDPLHKKATAYFDALDDDSDAVYITTEIITEVVTVLTLRYGIAAARTFTAFILHTDAVVRIPSALYFDVTLGSVLDATDNALSFTDRTLVVLSEQCSICTLDKALLKRLPRACSKTP